MAHGSERNSALARCCGCVAGLPRLAPVAAAPRDDSASTAADRDLRRDDRDALALANEQLIGAQREGSEDAVDSAEILNLIEGEGFRPWSFQQRAAAAPLMLT